MVAVLGSVDGLGQRPDVVNGGDVAVMQPRDGARFGVEELHLVQALTSQKLDGEGVLRVDMPRVPYGRETTTCDLFHELQLSKYGACIHR